MVTDLQIPPLEKKSGFQFNHIAFCSIYQRELQLNTLNAGKNLVNHPRGAPGLWMVVLACFHDGGLKPRVGARHVWSIDAINRRQFHPMTHSE